MAKRSTISKLRSANQQLVDEALQHGVFLSRYANDEAEKILDLLEKDVLPEYLGKLESRLSGAKARTWSTQRTKELVTGLDGTLRGGLAGVEKKLTKDMQDLAVSEAEWQRLALKKSTNVPVVDFRKPNPAMLRSIVTDKPFEGELMKDWWKRTAANTQEKVARQINIGMAAGESGEQIAKRIRGAARGAPGFQQGTVDVLRRNSEAVTRTAVNHVSTHARTETLNENSDMMKGVKIVATLDGRTTPICQSLDGKVYSLREGPRPPFHWNCRTTVVPILKSAMELGLPFDESAVPAARRAALGGDVPETETYQTWLKRQPAAFQDDVLGKARADMFRSNKFTVQQFVDERGRRLTLDELRAKAGMDPLPQKDPLGKVKPDKPFTPKLPNEEPPRAPQAPMSQMEFTKQGDRLPTMESSYGKKSTGTVESMERYRAKQVKYDAATKEALDDYAAVTFTEINEHLRLGKAINVKSKEQLDLINKAFKPSDEDLRLYRFSKPLSSLLNAEVGDTIKLKGFTSTSAERLVTDHWQKNSLAMEILAPKGSKLLHVGNADELEYLIAHGTEVEVVGHTEREFMESFAEQRVKKVKVVQLRIKTDATPIIDEKKIIDNLGEGKKKLDIVPGGIKLVKDKGSDITKYNKSDLIHLAKAVKHYGVENGAQQLALLRKIGVPEDLLQRIISGKPGVYDDLVTLLQKRSLGEKVIDAIEPIGDLNKKQIADELVIKDLKIVKFKGTDLNKYNKSDMIHLAKAIKHYGVEKAADQYNTLIKLGVPEDLLKDVISGKPGVYERLIKFREDKIKGLLGVTDKAISEFKIKELSTLTRPDIEEAPWLYSPKEVREALIKQDVAGRRDDILNRRSKLRSQMKELRKDLAQLVADPQIKTTTFFGEDTDFRKYVPSQHNSLIDRYEAIRDEYKKLGLELEQSNLLVSSNTSQNTPSLLRINPAARGELSIQDLSDSVNSEANVKALKQTKEWTNQFFGKEFFKNFEDSMQKRLGYKKMKLTIHDGYYRANANIYGTDGIHLSNRDEAWVVIHELGHFFDSHGVLKSADGKSTLIADLSHEFLEARTKGEPLVQLNTLRPGSGYDASEVTRPDKFKQAYTGKSYRNVYKNGAEIRATEVISIGIQTMFENPVKFAKEDPTYFEFILAIMRNESTEEVRRVIAQIGAS